jgi:hypothetical protein
MNRITDHLKYFSKLSAVFIFSLFKIYAIGIVSTIATLVLGIYILAESLGASLGHSSGLAFIIATVMAKPVSAGLFYLLIIIAPFVIAILPPNTLWQESSAGCQRSYENNSGSFY